MARYFCPECGDEMTIMYEESIVLCDTCGCSEELTEEEVEDYDGPTPTVDGIPIGCAACGGPYPDCKTACPLFDD